MQKTVLRRAGNQYVSAINSLVVDAKETAPYFRDAGFREVPAEATDLDRRIIAAEHPEFSAGLASGELAIKPTMSRGWETDIGLVKEIDYNIKKEDYVVEDWGPELQRYNSSSADLQETLRKDNEKFDRMRQDLLNRMEYARSQGWAWHDPIYIIYARSEHGNMCLRSVVRDILEEILTVTAMAAKKVKGEHSRKYRQAIKELSEVSGESKASTERIVAAQLKAVRLAEPEIPSKVPRYWTDRVYQ